MGPVGALFSLFWQLSYVGLRKGLLGALWAPSGPFLSLSYVGKQKRGRKAQKGPEGALVPFLASFWLAFVCICTIVVWKRGRKGPGRAWGPFLASFSHLVRSGWKEPLRRPMGLLGLFSSTSWGHSRAKNRGFAPILSTRSSFWSWWNERIVCDRSFLCYSYGNSNATKGALLGL